MGDDMSWQISFVDNEDLNAEVEAFNNNPEHATDFQRLLTRSECCEEGKLAAGVRTAEEHWSLGGEEARAYMLYYATGVRTSQAPHVVAEYRGEALYSMPHIVKAWVNGRIMKGHILNDVHRM